MDVLVSDDRAAGPERPARRRRPSPLVGCLLAYIGLAGLQVPVGAASRLAPSDLFLVLALGLAVGAQRLQHARATLPWLTMPVLLAYGLLVGLLAGQEPTQFVLLSKLGGGISLSIAAFLFQGAVRTGGTAAVGHAFFWGAVLVNSLGFIEFRFGVLRAQGFVYDSSQIGRFSGLAVDSNANAALVVSAMICGFHLLHGRSRPSGIRRMGHQLALGWLSYLFLISYSRGALVAGAVGVVYYAKKQIDAGVHRQPQPPTLLAGVLLIGLLYRFSPSEVLLGGRTDLRSVDARVELIDNGLALMNANDLNWVTGIGLGSFHSVYGKVIHSTPVWLYIEMGLVGIVAGVVLAIMAVAWRRRAGREHPSDSALWSTIVVIYVAMGLSIEALYQRPLWVALGCLAGLSHSVAGRAVGAGSPAPSRRDSNSSANRRLTESMS